MKKKKFLQDENALSEVLGFMLIIGILVSATTIYLSIQTPEWTKDYESRHADDIADDFSELKVLIDGIKGEIFERTTPIKMSPDKVPIFGMSPPGSRLNSLPDDESFVITPTVEGAPPPPLPESRYWEQNKTTGFDAFEPETEDVDTSANEVKLAKETVEYSNLTLDGETAMLDDERYYNQVIIKNSSILYLATSGSLKIHANNISLDSTSQIIADKRGHWGGKADAVGEGLGYGKAGDNGTGGGGAGYGGDGGDGGGNINSSGSYYGDETSFEIRLGSGGGGGGSGKWGGGSGGTGGGAILLEAEQINISGVISAGGGMGSHVHVTQDGGGGGGSGGSILIYGRNVTISGTLSVNGGGGGGDKATKGGGGGAGGRIKVFYGESLVNDTAHYSCSGGSGTKGGVQGANGTIYNKSIPYTPSVPYVSSGHFVSEVHDTTSDYTCYGEMTWNATLNGQTIVMKVRTDMFSDMRSAPDWPYCPEVSNGTDISKLSSAADGHQFIQYCAELSTEDTSITPVLDRVRINYNLTAPGGGNPVVANSSGIIKFNSNYLYYPNQEIVYEHGAVIKCQGKGEGKMGFMLHSPPIDISANLTTGAPEIEVSMIDLIGSDHSYSGSTTTSVENSYTDYNILSDNLRFPNLTLNLTTEYPSIWGDWFNKTLEKTTLTTPDNYTVSVNATARTVAVEFYGHVGGVQLYLEKTAVEVEI